MAGRPPKTQIDLTKNHMPKEEQKRRADSMPMFESQEFIPPEDLTKAELKVWNHLVDIYHNMTNCPVSDADKDLMELYCRAKVAADEADKKIKADPTYYISVENGSDKDGEIKYMIKINPNYKIRNDNMALCLKYFDQLGLSPLARARVGVKAANAKKEKNIFEEIMNRSDD